MALTRVSPPSANEPGVWPHTGAEVTSHSASSEKGDIMTKSLP
jgi:hypothetical protein